MGDLSNEEIVTTLFDAFENSDTLDVVFASFEKTAEDALRRLPSALDPTQGFAGTTVSAATKVVDHAFDVWDDVYCEKDTQLDERLPYENADDIQQERNDLDLSGLVILAAFRAIRPTLIALAAYMIEAAAKERA